MPRLDSGSRSSVVVVGASIRRHNACRKVAAPAPVIPSNTSSHPWLIAFATGLILSAIALPNQGTACGWWGDAEGDVSLDAIAVDRTGQAIPYRSENADTPEALTRQANQLRRFGAAGYAGAVRLYHQAAEAGFAPAQNNLGTMYEEGLGVVSDPQEAIRWYRLAAEQGEPHAQHSLGEMLLKGRGVEADIPQGLEWIERAAQQGHPSACADLGRYYAEGHYLEANADKAIKWWQRAHELGYPAAQEALATLRVKKNP